MVDKPEVPEYTEHEIFDIFDGNVETTHMTWVICALGVEMGQYKDWFGQFKEWQDAVVKIRDRALWLYEGFDNETADGKADWDWYIQIEETAKTLSQEEY